MKVSLILARLSSNQFLRILDRKVSKERLQETVT
ncbi:Hypothetical protein Minf_1554 [Methylacidiphilum infernorum V4]|uniref:Uncharacterized protein n=1 Tax=Methylacidiphilum infernorum (isolate V4) TaxID=481448 RepID=B3DWA5_METI4|nr:Hypothetical protein Minf_1554 [Methylacidiphilum infernorum V4]